MLEKLIFKILQITCILLLMGACTSEKNDLVIINDNSSLYTEGHQDLFRVLKKNADVIMLGDSLTDENEWHEFFPDIRIINRGIRGESSRQVLDRMNPVLKTEATYTFVMVGINDIMRNIETEIILGNIEEILTQLINANHDPVLQSVLKISESQLVENDQINELNLKLKNLTEILNIKFIDLNAVLAKNGYLEAKYTYDGIHLNGHGYQKWVEVIKPIINDN